MSITPVVSGVTRTNLGPFTTKTWTFSCTEVIQNDDSGWAAQTCIIDSGKNSRPTDDQDCWPPRTEGVPATTEALLGWGVYSPGIFCPDGYTSVAGSTYGVNSGFSFQYPLRPRETAIACCPNGDYQAIFDPAGRQTCVQFQPTTTFLVGTCNGDSPAYTPFAIPGTLGDNEYQSFKISAPLFQMVYRASDIKDVSSPSTSTAASIPSSPPNNRPGDANKGNKKGDSGSGSGLSAGATAGIAIGVVLAVILAATAGFCLWRSRRRKRYNGLPHHQQRGQIEAHHGGDFGAAADYSKFQAGGAAAGTLQPYGSDETKGGVVQADSRPVAMPVEMSSEATYGGRGVVEINNPSQPVELGAGHEFYR